MRIAYVVEFNAFKNSGVLKKITSQVSMWKKMGVSYKLFLISRLPGAENVPASLLNDIEVNIYYSEILNYIYKWTGKNHVFLNKSFTFINVLSDLKKYSPDLIYYRFGIWFPGQLHRFSKWPLIVELNTNDIDEVKLFDKATQLVHFKTRNRLLNRANGFCAVTNEIMEKVAPKNSRCIVLGNGIDISTFAHRVKKTNKERKQIVFVGSSGCPWHGVDKVICLARKLPKFDFNIIGPDLNDYNNVTSNIFFYGHLDGIKLSKIYEKMNIAISTLSLYKNKMNEASPLKTREYVVNGLPVIIGYKDTDLNNKDYILNVGNYEDNIIDNINEIEHFIGKWNGSIAHSDLDCIDMYKKEKKRLEFFKQFV